MSLFSKVLVFLCLIFIVFCGFFVLIRKGYTDEYIRIIAENYLSTKSISTSIDDLHFIDNTLSIKSINLKFPDKSYLTVKDFKIIFSLSGTILNLKIDSSGLSLTSNENVSVINFKLSTDYHFKLLDFSSQISAFFNNISGSNFNDASGVCEFKDTSGKKEIKCKLSDNTSNMDIATDFTKSFGKLNNLNAKIEIQNIPITIYQLAEKFIPNNGVMVFLKNFVKSGVIVSGSAKLNLDKEFFEKKKLSEANLNGNLNIANLELQYNKNYPALKNMDTKVSLSGSLMKFAIEKAYTSNTLISNALVELNWTGLDSSKVIVTGDAVGPAQDLTDFIPKNSLEEARINNVDLRKITGKAESKISIIIPLSSNVRNSYHISTEILNMGLKAFNNKIDCKAFKLSGKFDGDKVVLQGDGGKINTFDSSFNYEYNFVNKENHDYLLKIRSNIRNAGKIGIIKINSGNSILNFEYKSKDDQSVIKAESNLKNLDFIINKISIHKPAGQSAKLSMIGDIKSINNSKIDFELKGDNNLRIIGNIKLLDNKVETILPIISYENTSIKGKITSDKQATTMEVNGSSLDLSKADMMQFLEKERDVENETKLNVDIRNVLLKNDVELNNVKLNIQCDKIRCYKGYFDSTIGSKFLRMILKNLKDNEEWVITSNDAGTVFKALGMYKKMKLGKMLLTLNTSRKEVKSGEIIPILDGTFLLKRFVIMDTPFFLKIVSLQSLITKLFTHKDYVAFESMNGKINYKNDLMKVSNILADGIHLDLTMDGTINTKDRSVKLKGYVIPSFGLSIIAKRIPIIRSIISGVQHKGAFIPYSVNESY